MRLTLTPQTLPDASSHNVIADLKGAEHPEEVVIVSGHLDSWDLGTGAVDDAVGVAAAMQALEVIKRLGLHPKRTIRFIAWMNEENGGRGSQAYARNNEDKIRNHYAAIEMDLGVGHPIGFLANVGPPAMPLLRPIGSILSSLGAGHVKAAPGSVGADISPLEAAGVPGFAPLMDTRPYWYYHHNAADTFDKVGPRELTEDSTVLSVLAWALANLPEALPR
jgi:Zn-dependent M28 family amino/carboxypeptidase